MWGPTDVYEVHLPLPTAHAAAPSARVLENMKPDDKPIEGKKNDPTMPVAWTNKLGSESGKTSPRLYDHDGGGHRPGAEKARAGCWSTLALWAAGMEDKVPAKGTDVEPVGEYKPHPYAGTVSQKGVKPADLEIK